MTTPHGSTPNGPASGGPTPPSGSPTPRPNDAGRIPRPDRGSQVGLLLVILGGLALLSNIGLFHGLGNVAGALLFAAGGALLLRAYGGRAERLVVLVFGFALFGLAAAAIGGRLSGLLFLGLLGLGFVTVWANHRRHWWALIPGGVLLSLGLVAGLDSLFPRFDAGPVLFLGFAATFAALTRLPEHAQPWGIYPAIACVVVALLGLTVGGGWLLPLILIAGGAYLLTQRRREPVVHMPANGTAQGFGTATGAGTGASSAPGPAPTSQEPTAGAPSAQAPTNDPGPQPDPGTGPEEDPRG